ncbi:thiamine phosphate synthase [Rubripirellula amarantea]|nr:thiamine phosphate synthase [Rubripirellula amarantea]
MTKDSLEATYRILDASANRAGEGLRTLEEWTRFGLDAAELTAEFKQIRHDVAAVLGQLPRQELLAARDTIGDVGTRLETSTEYQRATPQDVVQAGIARTGQSLRVIEEYLKTIDARLAKTVEQARYRFYVVAAKLELLIVRSPLRDRIHNARLYLLIDAGSDIDTFESNVACMAQAGVDVFQLRDKRQTDRVLIDRARRATSIAHDFNALVLMNDRADLAMAAQCDGVHVGQDELPVEHARKIVGDHRLVGLSTHQIDQAEDALKAGADYIGCGPVFPSSTKTFQQYAGLEYLRDVAKRIKIPAFAIGGIELTNLDEVLSTHRIAVTGVVRDADDPVQMVKWLREKLDAATGEEESR